MELSFLCCHLDPPTCHDGDRGWCLGLPLPGRLQFLALISNADIECDDVADSAVKMILKAATESPDHGFELLLPGWAELCRRDNHITLHTAKCLLKK